jgi:hypothetical protein
MKVVKTYFFRQIMILPLYYFLLRMKGNALV